MAVNRFIVQARGVHFHHALKQPSLKLKTWSKQLSGSFLLSHSTICEISPILQQRFANVNAALSFP